MSDVTKLIAPLTKGFEVTDANQRKGAKPGSQKLVQLGSKTLAMITIREDGIKLEGSRLPHAVIVADAKAVAAAHAAPVDGSRKRPLLAVVSPADGRKMIQAVADENASKAKAAADKKAKPAGGKATGGKASSAPKPSGERARSHATSGSVAATKVA